MRNQTEKDDLLARAREYQDAGSNPFFGLSFIDGIAAVLEWLDDTDLDMDEMLPPLDSKE